MIYKICRVKIYSRVPRYVSVKQLCDSFPSGYVANILRKGAWNHNMMYVTARGRWGVSGFFPYKGNDYYIPKPALITENLQTLSTAEKKALRFTHYVNCLNLKEYFGASYDYMEATKEKFGYISHKEGDSFFKFEEKAGIYCIISADDRDILQSLVELLKDSFAMVAENQLKTTVKFTIEDVPSLMLEELDGSSPHCITLSQIETSQFDNELDALCNDGAYQIREKRSVFNESTGEVSTENSCVIEAGACVTRTSITCINQSAACDSGHLQFYYLTISMPV